MSITTDLWRARKPSTLVFIKTNTRENIVATLFGLIVWKVDFSNFDDDGGVTWNENVVTVSHEFVIVPRIHVITSRYNIQVGELKNDGRAKLKAQNSK